MSGTKRLRSLAHHATSVLCPANEDLGVIRKYAGGSRIHDVNRVGRSDTLTTRFGRLYVQAVGGSLLRGLDA